MVYYVVFPTMGARYSLLMCVRLTRSTRAVSSGSLEGAALARLNETLFRSERALLSEKGLPRRPWFKHQIYAPGFYTGYGVKTMPGVREGIEQRHWSEAEAEIATLAATLQSYAQTINRAAALLQPAKAAAPTEQ